MLYQIDWSEVAPLLACLGTITGIVVVILSLINRSVRKAQINVELKRDMVARGMTPEEICKVLDA